jgi:hypothetical protein
MGLHGLLTAIILPLPINELAKIFAQHGTWCASEQNVLFGSRRKKDKKEGALIPEIAVKRN